MSAKDHFFRGAIALAVNGVPIFNPIKNDGRTDTFLAGELDQWGGHCGRADDYHYHIGPVHLERIVGKGNPIGIALDGYLLYGYEDPSKLDWLNGQEDENGDYHYHSTKTYPYINGGFYGTVVERNGQVDPQPRAQGVRPALPPLRGAKITGYENPEPGSHVVRYEVRGEKRSVEYKVADNGSATFNFVSPQGTITENHTPRQRGGGGRGNAERPGEQRSGEQGRGDRSPTGTRSQGRQIDQLQPGGGSDPIARTLDANGDGQIDKAEWLKASAALRTLDQNQDGRITVDELGTGNRRGRAGEGEQPGGARPPGPAGSARGPQPGDGPRQPWIVVHADEVDLNQDKIISRAEIVGEASKAFAGYDANRDGKLTDDELGGRGGSRSAMGGFIRGHAGELDRDGDGSLTRAEVVANAARMFEKMDSNRDDTITTEELKNARR
jgi:Ca2+-binding EF-hand superfamily protein